MRSLHHIPLSAFLLSAVYAWTSTPFNPPSVPLAVRTPYLSCWLPQGSGNALNSVWPEFWTGSILGWAGFVKVDGVAYSFLGAPAVSGATFSQATQQSFSFTSTQSTFVLSAGPIDVTVNFLSPVEPTDLVKQSVPFSYMAVSAASTDGATHSVQIYSDISAEWVSGDDSLTVNWTTTTGDILTHQVQLTSPTLYGEVSDHTQYGSAFYSTPNTVSATYQTGQDIVVRAQFINNGVLANTEDTNFRAVSNDWPVFGLAHNLGSVGSTESSPVIYSVGHIRDPALEYVVVGGTQARSLYFWSEYSTPAAVISEFLGDYSAALTRATTFDAKVQSDASAISTEYAGIVALSVRQSLGANEITISKESSGAWNTSDVMVFLKEISSDGNVNTVDVINPAWPIYLYTNPALGKYLLEGLFRYQETGLYPNKWSVHDLGASYPKALGHNDGADEAMPVEECGNMLMMALSYAQKSGDNSQLAAYSNLLDQWTQYLISDSLIPGNQISTDDFAGSLANQTNLAIKGIVGIKAMSEIWGILGNTAQQSNYSSIASNYVTQWQTFATSTTGPHLTLDYNDESSWGLSYNLFGDKLLGLNLFPASVYDEQTAWYPTVDNAFGVPLDTRHTYTKTDWQIWTSTLMTNTATRDIFIEAVYKWASSGTNNAPLGDWYDTIAGAPEGFRARPVVGGHLAHLVL
ncbi:DUF1793-domain-containing protein [Lentinula edodes]|uniref:DUF1793-domain-containing protein n=1 Tax=Lentinula edodes TaxID=5353 RepID=A0A1Q3DW31_LENED|nr:hypothetical protein F5877DRAFT_76115 [Lentinula edodes]GAV98948.1 DUF1793-domain-containing protein [Lentinula edodes]